MGSDLGHFVLIAVIGHQIDVPQFLICVAVVLVYVVSESSLYRAIISYVLNDLGAISTANYSSSAR